MLRRPRKGPRPLFPDRRRNRERRLRLLPKTPEARISPASQAIVTFRKLALQRSGVSVGPRVPLRPAPPKGSASSDNSNRPSLWLLPQILPALRRRPYPSNRLLPIILTVPDFCAFRRFPALALGTTQRIKPDAKLRLFPDSALTPPQPENFGSFRHRFGKTLLTGTASVFSVGASAPSGFGNRKGREDRDERRRSRRRRGHFRKTSNPAVPPPSGRAWKPPPRRVSPPSRRPLPLAVIESRLLPPRL
uniref:uncharacterized protein LOC118538672 n=1 Tax=Halichoerus grypus TaxID=9711 RepID=UPI00165A03CE|nr:uncharacterized protein LOC118538672 [Halichoerus grypus]